MFRVRIFYASLKMKIKGRAEHYYFHREFSIHQSRAGQSGKKFENRINGLRDSGHEEEFCFPNTV